jgi:hypothetical protein
MPHSSTSSSSSSHAAAGEFDAHLVTQASTNYKEAFSLFDKRGNGRVPADELGDLLRACGQNPTMGEVTELQKGVGRECTFFFPFCRGGGEGFGGLFGFETKRKILLPPLLPFHLSAALEIYLSFFERKKGRGNFVEHLAYLVVFWDAKFPLTHPLLPAKMKPQRKIKANLIQNQQSISTRSCASSTDPVASATLASLTSTVEAFRSSTRI